MSMFRIRAACRRALFVCVCGVSACSPDRTSSVTAPPPPPSTTQTQDSCRVSLIADGDTFDCIGVGRVRFIGIDAPEMGQTPFGAQARAELSRIMPVGTTVRLTRDISDRDVYGRRLAYVWQDAVLMNEMLVNRGFALSARYPPDTAKIAALRAAEAHARSTNAGLWATGGFDCTPRDWRQGAC